LTGITTATAPSRHEDECFWNPKKNLHSSIRSDSTEGDSSQESTTAAETHKQQAVPNARYSYNPAKSFKEIVAVGNTVVHIKTVK